jgi:hypothetical protein
MELMMLSAGYIGSLAISSAWAGEWARRKGLNAKGWRVIGAAAGPLAVVAVGLRQPEAALCPHCKTPMRFEARFCATCRAQEVTRQDVENTSSRNRQSFAHADCGMLLPHGYFEGEPQGFASPAHAH